MHHSCKARKEIFNGAHVIQDVSLKLSWAYEHYSFQLKIKQTYNQVSRVLWVLGPNLRPARQHDPYRLLQSQSFPLQNQSLLSKNNNPYNYSLVHWFSLKKS